MRAGKTIPHISIATLRRVQAALPPDPPLSDLRGVLEEAVDDIESWATYASPYFQEKHDLAGTLKRYRDILAALP